MTLDDYMNVIGLPSGGAVRASLGLASDFGDVHRFFDIASEFVDLTSTPGSPAARRILISRSSSALGVSARRG